jgi:3-phosphoshikimate 1-carboxyvinyltransferase
MLKLQFKLAELPGDPIQIKLPGSKSISNRYLILNKQANNFSHLKNLSSSRDTQLLRFALENMAQQYWFEDGATPARFFLTYAAIKNLLCTVDGTAGLRNRSLKPLTDALVSAGATLGFIRENGYLPVKVIKGIDKIESIEINGSESSQFASAILLMAPSLHDNLTLRLIDSQKSKAYIEMTLACLKKFGVTFQSMNDKITMDCSRFAAPDEVLIESDWTAASYFYGLCACIPGSKFELMDLKVSGFQGDQILLNWGETFGVVSQVTERGVVISNMQTANSEPNFDFSNHIDLAPAIICTCAILQLKASFTGLENLIYKESNRITSIQSNLKLFGITLVQTQNTWHLEYQMNNKITNLVIDTFDDHRIAMSFALFSLKAELMFNNADCVVKSFPGYWIELSKCNFVIQDGT